MVTRTRPVKSMNTRGAAAGLTVRRDREGPQTSAAAPGHRRLLEAMPEAPKGPRLRDIEAPALRGDGTPRLVTQGGGGPDAAEIFHIRHYSIMDHGSRFTIRRDRGGPHSTSTQYSTPCPSPPPFMPDCSKFLAAPDHRRLLEAPPEAPEGPRPVKSRLQHSEEPGHRGTRHKVKAILEPQTHSSKATTLCRMHFKQAKGCLKRCWRGARQRQGPVRCVFS